MLQIRSVLIADEIEQECLDILKENSINAVKRTKLSEDQLIVELQNFDAVIVRSATKIKRKVIEATAGKLKLIGRAGTGVDNIDVAAATENGIVVMNTPGNSTSAAELTCSLILSLARRITEADRSMKENKWNRKDLMGSEVFGKTLAVIGLGRIGIGVAQRLQTFGMNTVGYDPFVKPEEAKKAGVTWMALDDIWPIADYITVHVPLTPETKNLIGNQTLKMCKRGVKIVNVARGGIVNESDLLEALNDGRVSGAALDVYQQEPPVYREIVEHPRVICTPHLGASTAEAQRRVAEEIAENIVALNAGNGCAGILNAEVGGSKSERVMNWSDAVTVLTKVASLLMPLNDRIITVNYPNSKLELQEIKLLEKSLWSAAATAYLRNSGNEKVNPINVHLCAKMQGIQIEVQKNNSEVISVCIGGITVCGYKTTQGVFICRIGTAKIPVPLLASGTLAISLKENQCIADLLDSLKANLCIEFGMIGGGHIATFSHLNEHETAALRAKNYVVIQFD